MTRILQRIEAGLGHPGLADELARCPGADLSSLLLAVMRARATRSPAELLRQYRRDRKVEPEPVPADRFRDLDAISFAAAPAFAPVELAPVAPLGTQATLGSIGQDRVVSALRGLEVSADPTTQLALEAAAQRAESAAEVRLCTAHRVLRVQALTHPMHTAHFRIFALATAGRDRGGEAFERDVLREQLGVWLRLFSDLADRGWRIREVEVRLADTRVPDALEVHLGLDPGALRAGVRTHQPTRGGGSFLEAHGVDLPDEVDDPSVVGDRFGLRRVTERLERVRDDVVAPLQAAWGLARFRFDLARLNGTSYYRGPCIELQVGDGEGPPMVIVDGGFTDWTARLLSNRKERFLGTGGGTALLYRRFAPS